MPDKISERVISIVICTVFVSALLLFAAAAKGQQIFTDPDNPNTVIRIENLAFITRGAGEGVYNVDFRYESALSVYGQNLEDFDFEGLADRSDALVAMNAVNDALNESGIRIPNSAGVPSENVFFIGIIERQGLVGAIGGEFMGSTGWQGCELPNCVLGLAIQGPNTAYTWADFTHAVGSDNEPPVADAGGPYGGTVGVAVTFDGSASDDPDGNIASYEWLFDDGSIEVGPNPMHTYPAPGVESVQLTVRDVIGVPGTDFTVAVIGSNDVPPAADAGGPYVETAGVAITFDGSASTDFDGNIDTFAWDFGDGSPLGAGETPTHTYAVDGLYPVSLTVTDDDNLTNTDNTTAVIGSVAPPPVADAGGPYIGSAGVAVDFDGTDSTAGSNASQRLTVLCGVDLATSTPCSAGEANATGILNLQVNGVLYDVEFKFDLAADTFTLPFVFESEQEALAASVEVSAALNSVPEVTAVSQQSSFDIPFEFELVLGYAVRSAEYFPIAGGWQALSTATRVPVGTPSSYAVFTAVSPMPDSDIVSFDWDFGDGSTGSGATVSHTYGASGLYDVTLTVTDDTAATDEDVVKAAIGDGNLPPVADAGGLVIGAPGVAVTFNGSASVDPEGGALTYAWDFGDGNTGTGATPTNTYAANDVYRVTLTVTDDAGVASSDGTLALIQDESDLVIEQITLSPSPALINEPITISIPIGNNGPSDEPAATASTTLPANITFGTATPTQGTCSESMGVIDCDLGPIASGGSVTITVTADAPPQTGPLTIGVTADGQNFDPNLDNLTASLDFDAVAAVSVQAKAKGGGAFGMIGLLLLALATIPRLSRKIRQTSFAVFLSVGFLCGLMLGLPNISQAEDWYVGAGGGATDIDSDTGNFVNDMAALGHVVSNVAIDDSGEGWKVFGGYNINEYFAAEVAYVDLGDVTASFDGVSIDVPQMLTDAGQLLPATGDGFSISALARYPFAERWAIFAEVGAFFWESDLAIDITGGSTTGTTNPSTDGTDVVYGVGGDLYIGDHFGLRVEWERYALDPNDVDLISASLLLRF